MACTNQHCQEECAERCQECDMLGMLTVQPLGNLYEPVHASGGLHYSCAGYGGYNDVNDVGRGIARFHSETQYQNGQTYSRYGAQSKASIA